MRDRPNRLPPVKDRREREKRLKAKVFDVKIYNNEAMSTDAAPGDTRRKVANMPRGLFSGSSSTSHVSGDTRSMGRLVPERRCSRIAAAPRPQDQPFNSLVSTYDAVSKERPVQSQQYRRIAPRPQFDGLMSIDDAVSEDRPFIARRYRAIAPRPQFDGLISTNDAVSKDRLMKSQPPPEAISPQPKPKDILHRTSLMHRRIARKPALRNKLRDMSIKLSPLVQITSGQIHPAFPKQILQFWLLTDAQLDDMAHFYHQRSPNEWSRQYPCPVNWGANLSLEDKRRKIGKFIGLRGCDTPAWLKTEEDIAAEARQARIAEEEEMWNRKLHPGQL